MALFKMLNRRQRHVLLAGGAACFGMLLYCPWRLVFTEARPVLSSSGIYFQQPIGPTTESFVGYSWLVSPPHREPFSSPSGSWYDVFPPHRYGSIGGNYVYQVDWFRLLLQWGVVAAVVVVLTLGFRDRESDTSVES